MISAETFRSQYSGNDTATTFAYGFPVKDKSHVKVVRTDADDVDTVLVVDVDYTVGGVDDPDSANWKVTYPISGDPLPTGERLTIVPNIPLKQLTDFANQGGFFAEVHEDAFDKLTLLVQQLKEQVNRCISLPVGTDKTGEDVLSEIDADASAAAASASNAAASAAAAVAVAEDIGIAGFASRTLASSNVTLTAGTDKSYQLMSGTLAGPVVVNLVRPGSSAPVLAFRVRLNRVVVTETNSLTFQENGAGHLVAFARAGTLLGNLLFVWSGTAWVLFENSVVTID